MRTVRVSAEFINQVDLSLPRAPGYRIGLLRREVGKRIGRLPSDAAVRLAVNVLVERRKARWIGRPEWQRRIAR